MANQLPQVVTVEFHGQQLITVKNGDDIFVAMKPVVEGMGLAWQSQHRKLSANKERWGITEMVMPSNGGDQTVICLPLRKLHGWLMTIHPGKIKDPVIRANVVIYQNECDDALWKYWSEGIAINPRATINPAQQSDLHALVDQISPDGKKHGMVWKRFNRHFRIAKYSQLPQSEFDAAIAYLTETFLTGDYLPASEPEALPLTITDEDRIEAARLELSKHDFICTFGAKADSPHPILYPIPEGSFFIRPEDFAKYIGDSGGRITLSMLPGIIAAAATRLAANQPRLAAA